MLAPHPAHRARRCAHHHALGRHPATRQPLHAGEQRPVGNAGCRKNAVALGEIFQIIDPVEILDSPFCGARTLVVERSQPHLQRWIVAFEGVLSREQAEELAGQVLRAAPKGDADDGDDDVLWVHELIGCEVIDLEGIDYGRVVAVLDNPASDVLELDSGGLVPLTFVVGGIEEAPHGGRVVRIDPPVGLFET